MGSRRSEGGRERKRGREGKRWGEGKSWGEGDVDDVTKEEWREFQKWRRGKRG